MKILSIAKYDFIKLIRDKTALLILILLPIIFTFVVGMIFGSLGESAREPKVPVGIVNYDNSDIAEELIAQIKSDKTLWVKELDEEQLYSEVKNAAVEAGFIIPEGFGASVDEGNTPQIKVVKLPTSAGFVAIEATINTAFTRIGIVEGTKAYFTEKLDSLGQEKARAVADELSKEVGERLKKPSRISVEEIRYSGGIQSTEYDGKAQTSIGYMVMFVMFTVIMGAGEILDEKKVNTWGRLNATPTSRLTIILGKILGTFLKGWFQVAILILFGKFALGISWGNSILATIVLISVYLLSITGIGMFLSTLAKTNAQLGAFTSVFIICTSMISGCWWPVEFQPQFMQRIASVFPQYWAIKGLLNTVVGNMGIQSIITPVLVLAAIGIVFFFLSVLNGRFKVEFRKIVTTTSGMEDVF